MKSYHIFQEFQFLQLTHDNYISEISNKNPPKVHNTETG